MGLFGYQGPKFIRMSRSAVQFLEKIGAQLEYKFQDTPSEYLILQAAGIYVTLKFGAMQVNSNVSSVEEAIQEAHRILKSFGIQRTVTDKIRSEVELLISKFIEAADNKDIGIGALVGCLDNMLDFYEKENSFKN